MRALLLIDLQADFLALPGLQPAPGFLVSRVAEILGSCRASGDRIVHLRTAVTQDPDERLPHWKARNLWRCAKGSPGCDPPAELAALAGELVLEKSGYTAPDLVTALSDVQVDTVLVAGVMLHACVRQAVLDLLQAGLRVVVAADAVGSDDPVHAAITRRYLEDRTITFAPVDELVGRERRGADAGEPGPAVATAANLAGDWRRSPVEERAALVERLHQPLIEEADSLARAMAEDLGKPVRFGRTEIARSGEMIAAVIARSLRANALERIGSARVRRQPHGVVAVVTPWNNPVYIPLGKILPAILYGNTVVWKPAPEAAGINRTVSQLFARCNWPDGLVARLDGGHSIGRALISEGGIDAVTITGSLAAGYGAAEVCARRHVPLQAELGGNNAAIVWRDADLAHAAREISAGAFDMAGQRCTANRRVIVHRDIAPSFHALLQGEAGKLRWGDPLDPETTIGPLVSHARRGLAVELTRRASADGVPFVHPLGSEPPGLAAVDRDRAWFPPVIFRCEGSRHELVQEESFAPILVMQTAGDWDEAIRLANDVRQGLVAALFTTSAEIVERFRDEARAGILKINRSTADAALDVPFGGWKASGVGPPEHGDGDEEFYTRPQTIYE